MQRLKEPFIALPLCATAIVWALAVVTVRAAESPATAPASAPAAVAAAASRPVARPLPELFRVGLRERKLEIAVVPPKDAEQTGGALVASAAVKAGSGDDAPPVFTPVLEFNAVGEEKWQVVASPRNRRRDGSYARFNVFCDSRVDDHWSSMQLTSVECDEEALTITGGGRMGRGFVSVTVRQDARVNEVRFTVQRPRRLRPRPLHEFAAQDLVQLYIEHQAELRQYLVPMLKEMYGQNPLRPRAGDVYRAFAAIPADMGVIEKVRAILPDFDAAAPPVRQAASAKIEALGPEGILAAQRIDRSELSPEQSARLDALVARNAIWPDPEAAGRKDAYFLIDCLLDVDPRVRSAALASLRSLKGPAYAMDVNATPEARAKTAEVLYEKLDDERDTPPAE